MSKTSDRLTLDRRRVRVRRAMADLSGLDVAEALGVPAPSYYRWEAGEGRISREHLRELAKLLRCRMGELTA